LFCKPKTKKNWFFLGSFYSSWQFVTLYHQKSYHGVWNKPKKKNKKQKNKNKKILRRPWMLFYMLVLSSLNIGNQKKTHTIEWFFMFILFLMNNNKRKKRSWPVSKQKKFLKEFLCSWPEFLHAPETFVDETFSLLVIRKGKLFFILFKTEKNIRKKHSAHAQKRKTIQNKITCCFK
jgi:hypothetical protein